MTLEVYLIAEGETFALQELRRVMNGSKEFDLDDLIKVAWRPQDLLTFLAERESG